MIHSDVGCVDSVAQDYSAYKDLRDYSKQKPCFFNCVACASDLLRSQIWRPAGTICKCRQAVYAGICSCIVIISNPSRTFRISNTEAQQNRQNHSKQCRMAVKCSNILAVPENQRFL